MPELPEIHRFATLINSHADTLYVACEQVLDPSAARVDLAPLLQSVSHFRLNGHARGKELLLRVLHESGEEACKLCFNHGLVGRWLWFAAREPHPSGTVLSFTDAAGNALSLVDTQRMARWRVGSFGTDRGPDPVDEHDEFRRKALSHKFASSEMIADAMLDQSVFNGIGNYLRAEILFRAHVSPFALANAVLHGPSASLLLDLCRDIPREVLSLGLNKYGNPDEVQRFEAWLQIYGKGQSKQSKGRKIWFSNEQITTDSTASASAPQPSKQTAIGALLQKMTAAQMISQHVAAAALSMTMQNPIIRAACETFEVDGDLAEAADTFNRLCSGNRVSFADKRAQTWIEEAFAVDHDSAERDDSLARIGTTAATATSLHDDTTGAASRLASQIRADDWREALKEEFAKDYFAKLASALETERSSGSTPIYPSAEHTFEALNLTPLHNVKAVLLGQDPYHGPGQAHGLCFSVQRGIKPPPSLVNVFHELHSDVGVPEPNHGCLTSWAQQGVLLLNAILTVREHSPMSHAELGWQQLTDTIIRTVLQKRPGVVFLLWGGEAQKKQSMIESLAPPGSQHIVLCAAHPSPMAGNKFLGCKCFSQTNNHLQSIGQTAINWSLANDDDDDDEEEDRDEEYETWD